MYETHILWSDGTESIDTASTEEMAKTIEHNYLIAFGNQMTYAFYEKT